MLQKIIQWAKVIVIQKEWKYYKSNGKRREGYESKLQSAVYASVYYKMCIRDRVMVTYEESEKVLFSADAFGTFGALNGNIFSDELEFDKEWLADARRYYANIVGKYGMQTQALLTKAAGLDIQLICSLHGPILSLIHIYNWQYHPVYIGVEYW